MTCKACEDAAAKVDALSCKIYEEFGYDDYETGAREIPSKYFDTVEAYDAAAEAIRSSCRHAAPGVVSKPKLKGETLAHIERAIIEHTGDGVLARHIVQYLEWPLPAAPLQSSGTGKEG